MTTSVSARSPATLNPTRQQLDELDALLRRMLELPVNKLEDLEQEAVEEPAQEPPPPEQSASPPPPDPLPTSQAESVSAARATRLATPPDPLPISQAGSGSAVKAARPATPPVSYMVVETASPRPLPPASGFEPRRSPLTPRLVPVTPPEVEIAEKPLPQEPKSKETPVPQHETPVPTKDEEMWVPLRSTWQPSAQTWQPLAESWHQAQSVPPVPQATPIAIPSPRMEQSPPLFDYANHASPESQAESPDLSPPTTDTPALSPATAAEPKLSLSAEDAPEVVSPLLLPLLWFNQGFDACLAPLGVPGRWLCGMRGRQTLGIVGVTCLAAAVAIAVSAGMGWTW